MNGQDKVVAGAMLGIASIALVVIARLPGCEPDKPIDVGAPIATPCPEAAAVMYDIPPPYEERDK
jgi:hypothetical protein